MTSDLTALADRVRTFGGLTSKAAISLVSEVFGGSDWLAGPGDDGAAVAFDGSFVVACGEALLPGFVQRDPFGAGLAAVLTNVNDLAAMGARPLGIVDTVVADEPTARRILEGIRHGCHLYDVPLLGGHLTRHDRPPALSAFGLGRAERPLSVNRVAAGQTLVLGCAIDGELRTDFPFFRGFDERGTRSAGDVRLLADLAERGCAVAAKDVSMAGLVGSLGMLLERNACGATVDLDVLPRPAGVAMGDWLTCFPSYAFLVCCPPRRADECVAAFIDRDLAAAAIGSIDTTGEVVLSSGGEQVRALSVSVTGLSR